MAEFDNDLADPDESKPQEPIRATAICAMAAAWWIDHAALKRLEKAAGARMAAENRCRHLEAKVHRLLRRLSGPVGDRPSGQPSEFVYTRLLADMGFPLETQSDQAWLDYLHDCLGD